MNQTIKINNLTKSFGDVKAVQGVTYSVKKGEMFGLVGPDGAGKTTTIRMLCGLLKPDDGSAEILDMNLTTDRNKIQDNVGYLSQKFSLYGDLTIDENIEFFADIHNVKDYEGRRNELLEFTRLTPFRKRLADNLSGGMKQKLALACSLIHRPKILYLDEPTTGVDPVSRRDFWKILSSLMKEGITILMSTPYLDEAERCNRVALMDKGKIIVLDTPKAVKDSIKKVIAEIVCTKVREAYKLVRDDLKKEVQLFGDRINVLLNKDSNEYEKIKKYLNENSIEVISHRMIPPSLENVFIHLVEKESSQEIEDRRRI
ncbi:MAG TPA: ABC transporter ATP-binding protein [Ignavibacteriaceae bacterium]|nr:ABC transporter ATP-binding protein [Ignavibacteriaceae bacterium]